MKYSSRTWTAALAAVILAGCGNTVHLDVQAGGKTFLHTRNGDTVVWNVDVTFKHGYSPCKEGLGPLKICTMQNEMVYAYDCQGCADPGGKNGSGIGTLGELGVGSAAATPSDSQPGYIYCDSSHGNAATADPIVVSASTGSSVSKVQWFLLGNPSDKTFKVNLQSGTCASNTQIDQGNPTCTLAPGAVSQTYTLTAGECSAQGSAMLTIH